MEMSSLFFVFIFGAIIGSFLNVVAMRHNTGVGLHGRSFCFSCSHTLSWYDLIPILSFVFSGARCRYCNTKISWQYPLIEVITGLFFVFLFLKFSLASSLYVSNIVDLSFYLIVFSLLLVIGIYDTHHKIIPNRYVYTFIALSLLPALGVVGAHDVSVWNIFGGVIIAVPLAFLWLVSKGAWLGLGDAKLTLGMGLLLGLSSGVAAVMIAFWIGALFGLAIIALNKMGVLLSGARRYTIKSEIPFGPFLICSTFIVFFYDITFLDIQAFLTF